MWTMGNAGEVQAMPRFIFAYHGGATPTTPAEQEATMSAWTAWFGDLGNAVVDGGNPVGMSRTVTKDAVTDNGGANPISGYSIVEAADQDAACDMARGCPMVRDGSGSVEVAQIHEL
jgi:hypothetical protein